MSVAASARIRTRRWALGDACLAHQSPEGGTAASHLPGALRGDYLGNLGLCHAALDGGHN